MNNSKKCKWEVWRGEIVIEVGEDDTQEEIPVKIYFSQSSGIPKAGAGHNAVVRLVSKMEPGGGGHFHATQQPLSVSFIALLRQSFTAERSAVATHSSFCISFPAIQKRFYDSALTAFVSNLQILQSVSRASD